VSVSPAMPSAVSPIRLVGARHPLPAHRWKLAGQAHGQRRDRMAAARRPADS
jgi:hypothetical protein